MQVSELFRRGIVVPLDEEAARQLRAGAVEPVARVDYAELASESDFAWLWTQGFFARISEHAGVELADYEERELDSSLAPFVAEVAAELASRTEVPAGAQDFLVKLGSTCRLAAEGRRPLFVVL